MHNFSSLKRIAVRNPALLLAFVLALTAQGQNQNRKKWTYDFSEKVSYFETPLAACQSYVKEKYPNDNYKASVEATSDVEMFRCSADETYIGLVYKRECKDCGGKPQRERYSGAPEYFVFAFQRFADLKISPVSGSCRLERAGSA